MTLLRVPWRWRRRGKRGHQALTHILRTPTPPPVKCPYVLRRPTDTLTGPVHPRQLPVPAPVVNIQESPSRIATASLPLIVVPSGGTTACHVTLPITVSTTRTGSHVPTSPWCMIVMCPSGDLHALTVPPLDFPTVTRLPYRSGSLTRHSFLPLISPRRSHPCLAPSHPTRISSLPLPCPVQTPPLQYPSLHRASSPAPSPPRILTTPFVTEWT